MRSGKLYVLFAVSLGKDAWHRVNTEYISSDSVKGSDIEVFTNLSD